jgi:hypothetical protein
MTHFYTFVSPPPLSYPQCLVQSISRTERSRIGKGEKKGEKGSTRRLELSIRWDKYSSSFSAHKMRILQMN